MCHSGQIKGDIDGQDGVSSGVEGYEESRSIGGFCIQRLVEKVTGSPLCNSNTSIRGMRHPIACIGESH